MDSAEKRTKSCAKQKGLAKAIARHSLTGLNIIIFHDGLIFHTAIIINRKNWRITIKLHFENLSIFFKKSERTHTLGPPPPVRFCSLFNDPPLSPPQRKCFLNDPKPFFPKFIIEWNMSMVTSDIQLLLIY